MKKSDIVENLNIAIDILKKVALTPELFDINSYCTKMNAEIGDIVDTHIKNKSIFCAAGWIAIDPHFQKLGVYWECEVDEYGSNVCDIGNYTELAKSLGMEVTIYKTSTEFWKFFASTTDNSLDDIIKMLEDKLISVVGFGEEQ